MEALLAGDFDDDDDDDDESFDEEGNAQEEDDDDDDADDEQGPAVRTYSRLPLHDQACSGDAESLTAALGEGARTGSITIGKLPDGTPRTVSFDLNQANEQNEPPLHATLLAAANAMALAAAPSDDPWVRAAAREDGRLLNTPVPSPLASTDAPTTTVAVDPTEALLTCMKLLLDAGAEPERKVYGRSALHLACACAALPALATFAAKVTELLLAGGASITQIDACGKTPLHYAAVASGATTLNLLLAQPSASEAAGLVDKSGASALHDALRGGKPCAANALLLIAASGGAAMAADLDGLTPLHLAMAAGFEDAAKALLAKGADTGAKDAIGRVASDLATANSNKAHASLPVLLLAHPASLLHNAPAGIEADTFTGIAERRYFGQPECAARLRSLLSPAGHLRGCRYADLEWKAAPIAQITGTCVHPHTCPVLPNLADHHPGMPPDVLRCHEYTYVDKVRQLCGGLSAAAKANSEAGDGDAPSRPLKSPVDCDTEVTQHSYVAAMRGAGAVVEAVRAVCAGPREAASAFCAVRPPGHHAGPSGAVGGQSAGFCVLANAAIGAAYAMAVHRDKVKKVAIIDFDIHHGNGTEACVQAVLPTTWTESVETPAGTVGAQPRNPQTPPFIPPRADVMHACDAHGR